MRRRWRWKWGRETIGYIAGGWFVIGVVPVVAAAMIFDGKKNHHFFPAGWAFIAWLGPYALAGVGCALYGLVLGLRWVVRHPPLRREWTNSPDIREVHRAED